MTDESNHQVLVPSNVADMTKRIPITDHVPKEMQDDGYRAIRDKMELNLARTDKLDRYATHESGHLIYLIKTGLLTCPQDAIFEGPTLYLKDGEVREFSAAVSSKRIRLTDDSLVYTQAILEKVSLASAAASEFEKELLGADEVTETAANGDKGTLFDHCKKARHDDVEFEGITLWSSAQSETRKWVHENRTEVDQLVSVSKQVIFIRCFGINLELSAADISTLQQRRFDRSTSIAV